MLYKKLVSLKLVQVFKNKELSMQNFPAINYVVLGLCCQAVSLFPLIQQLPALWLLSPDTDGWLKYHGH